MNKKELKAYQDKLMGGATGTIKLGVVTGVGSTVLGTIGSGIPAAAPALGAANTALNFAAIGNMAAVGMSILPTQTSQKPAPVKRAMPKKRGSPMDNPASYF